jgi:hypothetical protein
MVGPRNPVLTGLFPNMFQESKIYADFQEMMERGQTRTTGSEQSDVSDNGFMGKF